MEMNKKIEAVGKFTKKVSEGFSLEVVIYEGETFVRTCSVSPNYKSEDSALSVMYGSNKKHVNKKYKHIDDSVRRRGKIRGSYYFNSLELMSFLQIYSPRFEEDKKRYEEFKIWCVRQLLSNAESEKKEKTVVRKQSYNIEIHHYDDGTVQMFRTNDGFHAIELLGICELAQADIIEQLKGTVKVDKVVRTVVDRENGNN